MSKFQVGDRVNVKWLEAPHAPDGPATIVALAGVDSLALPEEFFVRMDDETDYIGEWDGHYVHAEEMALIEVED